MPDTLLIVEPDVMFASRIELGARDAGFAPRIAASEPEARDALADRPVILAINLQAPGIDAPALIREASTAGARVLAFGRHTDAAALRAARDAGAHETVARSQIAEDLPALLARLAAARAT